MGGGNVDVAGGKWKGEERWKKKKERKKMNEKKR